MLQFASIGSQETQFWRTANFSQSQKLQFARNRSQELKFGMVPFQLNPGAQAATRCRDNLHRWQALLAEVRLSNQQIPSPPAEALKVFQFGSICSQEIRLGRAASFLQSQDIRFACSHEMVFSAS